MVIALVRVLATTTLADPAAAAPDPPVGTIVPPIEGYVWGWQPAAASYTSTTGYEHNSAGGAVQVTRQGVGRYAVRFVDMAGQGGVAHVSAYGANNICTVVSWGPLVGDEFINVHCYTAAGASVDSRFVAHVSNRKDGAARGYLYSDDATPPAGGTRRCPATDTTPPDSRSRSSARAPARTPSNSARSPRTSVETGGRARCG
jgi:hypothetical protein